MHSFSALELASRVCGRLVSPKQCVVCGSTQESSLCARCLEEYLSRVPRTELAFQSNRCERCGRPLISLTGLCTPCRNTDALASVDRAFSLFSYSGAAPFLLAKWKTRGDRSLTWIFCRFLAPLLRELTGGKAMIRTVVPVPPRPGKIRLLGWDQIEDLSRALERQYAIPIARCLVRNSSHEQKLLGREGRAHNLKGSIQVAPRATIPARAIVLDDLMTTGATLNACATALREAGCSEVYGITLFYD